MFDTAEELDQHIQEEHEVQEVARVGQPSISQPSPRSSPCPSPQPRDRNRNVAPQMYGLKCELCPWKSFTSYNARTTQAMVNEKRLHIETDLKGGSEGIEEGDDYKRLTVPVQVEAGMDDREFRLRPARKLLYPLNWKVAAHSASARRAIST